MSLLQPPELPNICSEAGDCSVDGMFADPADCSGFIKCAQVSPLRNTTNSIAKLGLKILIEILIEFQFRIFLVQF